MNLFFINYNPYDLCLSTTHFRGVYTKKNKQITEKSFVFFVNIVLIEQKFKKML